MVALALACAAPSLAKPPRDDIFDPATLQYASCDGVVYGADGPDQLTAQPGQSLTGLAGDDMLTGATRTSCLTGGDGNDSLTAQAAGESGPWIDGGPGRDRLVGGPLDDDLKGGDGDDVVTGGNGPDTIDGGAGNDRIDGGAGNDRITGGAGHNTIDAGSGNDLISANDGSRERIDCGPGDDVVHADRGDRTLHCEHVKFRSNPYPRVSPRRGELTTLFAVSFIAPEGTEPGATDSGSAGYEFNVIRAPKPRCELFFKDATPLLEMGDRYRAHFRISPRRATCRGSYKVAVTFENSSVGVECNSASGEPKPRSTGNYGDCPYSGTVGYFAFRIR